MVQNLFQEQRAKDSTSTIIIQRTIRMLLRQEGLAHYEKFITWLEKADRFHGVFPHWWYGETGKVKPFSPNDDGGDLVETSYLAQGLITVREYFKDGNNEEKALAAKIDQLWRSVEWDWYTN